MSTLKPNVQPWNHFIRSELTSPFYASVRIAARTKRAQCLAVIHSTIWTRKFRKHKKRLLRKTAGTSTENETNWKRTFRMSVLLCASCRWRKMLVWTNALRLEENTILKIIESRNEKDRKYNQYTYVVKNQLKTIVVQNEILLQSSQMYNDRELEVNTNVVICLFRIDWSLRY